MSRRYRSKIDAVAVVTLVVALGRPATAEPLRLRGDALVQTQSPVGLLVLRGEDRLKPWLDAESVVWLGASSGEAPLGANGDVLTLSVRARDIATGSELRAGRMVVSMGAIRPVHIDGARALGRAFGTTTVEAFGGVPVVPLDQGAFRPTRPFDWTAGGRLGEAASDKAAAGVSYAVRRHDGQRDEEEAGVDMALTPAPWFTAAGRAAFDLVTRGPTDVLGSVSAQKRDLRVEVFVTHRSPGRLLPSTSLFSVLGDFAATSTGPTFRWRAFPRLELVTTGSFQAQGPEVGGQGLGRATLALDDDWAKTLGVEMRRVDFNGARWSGTRGVATLPLTDVLRLATELELVRPDRPRGGAALWPWALVAVAWRWQNGWEAAAAVEGSSGPAVRESVQALGRLSYAFGERRTP
jgi:hypothetical protein